MGIKWNEVKVTVTALGNQIVLAKVDKKGLPKDKSEDKTMEVLSAVCAYMDGWSDIQRRRGMTFTVPGGTLTWMKASEEEPRG